MVLDLMDIVQENIILNAEILALVQLILGLLVHSKF